MASAYPQGQAKESSTTAARFALFGSLPAELRDQIWEHAVAGCIRPALVQSTTLARLRELFPSFYWRVPWPFSMDSRLRKLFFRAGLEKVRVDIPLTLVSYESRAAVSRWLRSQATISNKDGHLQREFDPGFDLMYIDEDSWFPFTGRTLGPHPFPESITHAGAGQLTCVAVDGQWMVKVIGLLGLCVFISNLRHFANPNLLYIIADWDDSEYRRRGRQSRPLWEIGGSWCGQLGRIPGFYDHLDFIPPATVPTPAGSRPEHRLVPMAPILGHRYDCQNHGWRCASIPFKLIYAVGK